MNRRGNNDKNSQAKEYKLVDFCSLIFVLLMGCFYIQPVEASEEDTASILVDVQPKEYEIRNSYLQFTPEL